MAIIFKADSTYNPLCASPAYISNRSSVPSTLLELLQCNICPTPYRYGNCSGAPCQYTSYDVTVSGMTIGFGGGSNNPSAPNSTWRIYSNSVKPVPGWEGQCVWSSEVFQIDFCVGTPGSCLPYAGCDYAHMMMGYAYWFGYVNPAGPVFDVSLRVRTDDQNPSNDSTCIDFGLRFKLTSYVIGGNPVYCPNDGASGGWPGPGPDGVSRLISFPNGYDATGVTASIAAVP